MKVWGKRLTAAGLAISLSFGASVTGMAASSVSEIQKEIKRVKEEQQQSRVKAQALEQKVEQLSRTQQELRQELAQLDKEIGAVEEEIAALNGEIGQTEEHLEQAEQELADAEARVLERDQLLKTRVRLMYQKGSISYLEVLFGSKDFSDFLDRVQALELIVTQDATLLEEQKQDRELIKAKKAEVEEALATLQTQRSQSVALQQKLEGQQQAKGKVLDQLNAEIEEAQEFEEEERQRLMELAQQQSKLQQELNRARSSQKGGSYNGVFLWPVPASTRVTSDFGLRIHPISGKSKGHTGVDIGRPPSGESILGSDIVAADGGEVLVAQYTNGYGNTVIPDHGGGVWTLYAHMRQGGIKVRVGESVKRGQKIGEVGSTGNSTGPHLHFEVIKNGNPINPWTYLK